MPRSDRLPNRQDHISRKASVWLKRPPRDQWRTAPEPPVQYLLSALNRCAHATECAPKSATVRPQQENGIKPLLGCAASTKRLHPECAPARNNALNRPSSSCAS